MTVQELIDKLDRVKDKGMDVTFYHGTFYYKVEDTQVTVLADGKEYFNLY